MEPSSETTSTTTPQPGTPQPGTPLNGAVNSTTTEQPGTGPRFRLRRSRTDRMLGGVCGGVAKMFTIDATLVRIAMVVLTIIGVGSIALLYIAAWLIVPEEDGEN